MRLFSRLSDPPWPARLAVWALLCAGFGLYACTLAFGPLWDDHVFVFGEPFLSECSNLLKVVDPSSLWTPLQVKNAARPVWLGSVLVDSCVYGGGMPGMRLTSIALHAAGALVFLLLAFRLSRCRWTAFFAALLFVTHPVHTESVNFITFRTDLLAFLFMVPGLLLYLHGRARAGRERALSWAGAGLCYLLAMLSKEMAVTLPLLILAADRLFPVEAPRLAGRRGGVRLAAVMIVLLMGFLVFRTPRSGYRIDGHLDAFSRLHHSLVSPPAAGMKPGVDKPPWNAVYEEPLVRAFTMAGVFRSYLRLLYWPFRLQGDYSPPVLRTPADIRVLGGLLGLALTLVGAWRLRKRRPLIAFGLFWSVATLIPVSGMVSLFNLQAERYLFIPSAGACLVLAGLFAELRRIPGPAARFGPLLAPLALAVVFGVRTVTRNQDFRDEAGFYRATVETDPGVGRAHLNLARLLRLRGDAEGAERGFRSALEHWPEAVLGRGLFAAFLDSQGRGAESILQLEAAAALAPDAAWVQLDLGRSYIRAGRVEQALARFDEVLRFDPDSIPALIDSGEILVRAGSSTEGVRRIRRAAALSGWHSAPALHALWTAARTAKDEETAKRAMRALERADPELAARISVPVTPDKSRR